MSVSTDAYGLAPPPIPVRWRMSVTLLPDVLRDAIEKTSNGSLDMSSIQDQIVQIITGEVFEQLTSPDNRGPLVSVDLSRNRWKAAALRRANAIKRLMATPTQDLPSPPALFDNFTEEH